MNQCRHPILMTPMLGVFWRETIIIDLSLFAFITDKMFTLAEIIKEGSLQTDHKEQFLLLMPVPESHFSKLMQR